MIEQRADPVHFGPPERFLFGWLHRPAGPEQFDVGLVICPPIAHEAMSTHRTCRRIAMEAASRGICTLRFDYDGTGDSAGVDTDPDRVPAWRASIAEAARQLRSACGVNRVCLLGIRLGATLAILESEELAEVDAVIALNPVPDGRRYLRELRAFAAVANQGMPPEALMDAAGNKGIAGFAMLPATTEAIGGLRLAADVLKPTRRRVLLLERDDLAPDEGLYRALAETSTDVVRMPFAGYADMMRDAHESAVPEDLIAGALDWMMTGAATGPAAASSSRPPRQGTFRWTRDGHCVELSESITTVPGDPDLFAIATTAADPSQEVHKAVLVLLNSGAVHHVGPHRLYVKLARHCASQGIPTWRIDLPGIGDTPPARGAMENVVYPDAAADGVRAVLEHVRHRHPESRIYVAGICSGAYHGLKAAVNGLPVDAALIINPLTFFWKPGMSLSQPRHQDTSEVMRYRSSGLGLRNLARLLTGKVNVLHVARTIFRYALQRLGTYALRVARVMGWPLREDLMAELRAARKHGATLHFIFSRTDPGHELLVSQAGGGVTRMQNEGSLSMDFVDDSDHTFTPLRAQRQLKELIVEKIRDARTTHEQ